MVQTEALPVAHDAINISVSFVSLSASTKIRE